MSLGLSLNENSHFIRKPEFREGHDPSKATPREKALVEMEASVMYGIQNLAQHRRSKSGEQPRTRQLQQQTIHESGREDRFKLEETLEGIKSLLKKDRPLVLNIMQGKVSYPDDKFLFLAKPGQSDSSLITAKESATLLFDRVICGKREEKELSRWELLNQNYLTFDPAPSSDTLVNTAASVQSELVQLIDGAAEQAKAKEETARIESELSTYTAADPHGKGKDKS